MEKVNYTEAQVLQIVQDYKAGVSIDDIAKAVGKSTKSIVAKLSREGVYKAKSKMQATSRKTKADLIAELTAELGAAEGQLESLEKATHDALAFIVAKVCFKNTEA